MARCLSPLPLHSSARTSFNISLSISGDRSYSSKCFSPSFNCNNLPLRLSAQNNNCCSSDPRRTHASFSCDCTRMPLARSSSFGPGSRTSNGTPRSCAASSILRCFDPAVRPRAPRDDLIRPSPSARHRRHPGAVDRSRVSARSLPWGRATVIARREGRVGGAPSGASHRR